MAELADAQRSGRCMGNHVQVRILPGALKIKNRNADNLKHFRFFYLSNLTTVPYPTTIRNLGATPTLATSVLK